MGLAAFMEKTTKKSTAARASQRTTPVLSLALKISEALMQQAAMRAQLYADLRRTLSGASDDSEYVESEW